MENSLNNQPQSFAQPQTKSAAPKVLIVLLVVVILGLAAYFGLQFYKEYKISQIAPASLLGTEAQMEVVKAEVMPIMKFESNESLSPEAIVYTENKYQFEVLQDFYNKIVNNGWVAVDGSLQQEDKSVFKVSDGTNLMFVTIEGGLNEPSTKVTISKVLKNK